MNQAAAGDDAARNQVFEHTYHELHTLARRLMHRERAAHTLSPTALVHELYLRLYRGSRLDFESRDQFLRYARTAMAHLLVDHARRRNSQRRNGQVEPMLDEPGQDDAADSLAVVDQALEKLAHAHPRASRVLEMRCLAALDVEQTAELLGTSVRTVCRDWDLARGLLARMLEPPTLTAHVHDDTR
ncbi:MAG: sigma-70 family RNA polymerase sigma factor [Xanthomonadales bacterium]|nr:sigma-70 family RNA polymerase sigma factor [Xanthomonadales bacterium]